MTHPEPTPIARDEDFVLALVNARTWLYDQLVKHGVTEPDTLIKPYPWDDEETYEET